MKLYGKGHIDEAQTFRNTERRADEEQLLRDNVAVAITNIRTKKNYQPTWNGHLEQLMLGLNNFY